MTAADRRLARSPLAALLPIVAAALLAALAPAGAAAQGAKHPRLVSTASAKCATCHGDLTEGRKTVHAALDDCTSCHEVATGEAGTTVKLAAADPALCLTCHDGLAAAVEGTLAAPHPVVADGCLTCHAPHASDQPRLLLDAQAALCGNCHDAASLAAKHGNLLGAATACTGCHLPHGGPDAKLLSGAVRHAPFADATCSACHRPNFGDRIRLQARGQRLCLACHDDPAAPGAAGGSVHGALADDARGRAGCLSCHQPHLSAQKRMLLRGGVELCAGCHGAVAAAAQAKTGHAAAAEDCANCHAPHASAQPHLLAAPPRELCATCHDPADAELTQKHLGADLAQADCLACHSPHGAGQPKLLAGNVHPPVLEGCDNCHEGASNRLLEGGGQALCVTCHSDVPEIAAKAVVQHPAMESDACATCHNPHASERAKLLRAPEQSCGECHSDQLAGAGEVQHGVIAVLGCQACHEPHGGSRPKLLRAEGAALCLACHDATAVEAAGSGALAPFPGLALSALERQGMATLRLSAGGTRDHPTFGHRTLGQATEEELKRVETRFRGELFCLTCHDPHKGRSSTLLRWNAPSASEACLQCHPM